MTPDEAREAAVEALRIAPCIRLNEEECYYSSFGKHPECALAALLTLKPEILAALVGMIPISNRPIRERLYAFPDTEAEVLGS